MTNGRDGEKRGLPLAFGVTWLAYATYYLGRKGLSVSKAKLVKEAGIGETALATIDTGYLTAYALGLFLSGMLGDRVGARRLVSAGMLAAALTCAACGASRGAMLLFFAFTLNGLAQSTGWPGTTKAMAEWTAPASRGSIMGFWCTSYQIGGIAATWFSAWLLGHYGYQSVFYVPALVIAAVGILVFLALREGPFAAPPRAAAKAPRFALGELFRSRALISYGIAYFFIKLIRYSFLFWLPYYLHIALGFAPAKAGYLSVSFEIGGVLGSMSIGLISDRLAHLSRSIVAAAGLLGLAAALLLYAALSPTSPIANFFLLALIGALLFGPDSIISGVAAQDAAGPAAAATATGFVNGVGSAGAILQGYVTVGLRGALGWSAVFYAFVAFAMLSAAALIPTFRRAPLAVPSS